MTKYKNKYRIESNRWRCWDYSALAQYFLTICIQDREHILGKIADDKMILSPAGKIVQSEIENIPTYHPRIILDEWVVMPNHVHLIVELKGYDYDNGNDNVGKIHEFSLPQSKPNSQSPSATPSRHWWQIPNYIPNADDIKQYRKFRRKMLIPKIMGKLKMITSKQINFLNNTSGHRNWQPNYHDYIIRNQKSYYNIKNYIINNPRKWENDKFR